MANPIPDKYADLFDKKVFAGLATLMPDGAPQVTPVWIDYDGANVLFNTAIGRQKDKHLQAQPRVSVMLVDPENPYRYLEVRGKIVKSTEEGAVEHIESLSRRYTGNPYFTDANPQGDQIRVTFLIEPTRVLAR